MIVGYDAGNNENKIIGPNGPYKFLSVIGEYRDLKLKNELRPTDIVWEYEGHSLKKGFAGTLAADDCEFAGSVKGMTKAHEDVLLRILIGLHQYCDSGQIIKMVVGQPIEKHENGEKQRIIDMVKRTHKITVNGENKTFHIKDVLVTSEAGGAFWSMPQMGLTRILDVGSGTINAATIKDKRYVDMESYTLPFGMETNKTRDINAMARKIKTELPKWGEDDPVYLCGGASETLIEPISAYFPNAQILKPKYKDGLTVKLLHPVFANAVGFYNLASGVFR